MRPSVYIPDASGLVAGLMSLLHGWASYRHTDGMIELRPHQQIGPCPECEQDLARVAVGTCATRTPWQR